MAQGWYVYRSVGQHAPFDLAIYRNGQVARVEVKTAKILTNVNYSSVSMHWPRNDEWDILAVVANGRIVEIAAGSDIHAAKDQIAAELDIKRPDHGTWVMNPSEYRGE